MKSLLFSSNGVFWTDFSLVFKSSTDLFSLDHTKHKCYIANSVFVCFKMVWGKAMKELIITKYVNTEIITYE